MKKIMVFLISFFIIIGNVHAASTNVEVDTTNYISSPIFILNGDDDLATPESICASPSYRKVMRVGGVVLNFVKILVPIAIIAFGVVDLYKAVVSSKDDRISKAVKSIAVRVVAGVAIFLLPGLVQFALSMVQEWSNYEVNWCCCTECLLNGDCEININSCSDSCSIGG